MPLSFGPSVGPQPYEETGFHRLFLVRHGVVTIAAKRMAATHTASGEQAAFDGAVLFQRF